MDIYKEHHFVDHFYGVGAETPDYGEPKSQEPVTEMSEYRHRIASASLDINNLINQMDGFFGRLYGEGQSAEKKSEKPMSVGHHGLLRSALSNLEDGISVLEDRIARLQEHG